MSLSATQAQHLLIPFASPDSADCRTGLSALNLPNLQALLARLTRVDEDNQDNSTLSPPHERALARAHGWLFKDGLLPWAALQAQQRQLPDAHQPGWGLLTLCHWQVGMSEVVLNDPEHLSLSIDESNALLRSTQAFFEEDGLRVFATPKPGQWLIHGSALQDLPTASLDRAVNQPLAEWLPMSDAARPIRRLQNEMQMLLYTHPVNDVRGSLRQWPVNSFWLSGTGSLPSRPNAPQPAPLVCPDLRDSALQHDGYRWSRTWETLDAEVLAPWRQRAEAGEALTLTLCGSRAAQRFENRPRSLSTWACSKLRPLKVQSVLEAL